MHGPRRSVTAPELAQALGRIPSSRWRWFPGVVEEKQQSPRKSVDNRLNDLNAQAQHHHRCQDKEEDSGQTTDEAKETDNEARDDDANLDLELRPITSTRNWVVRNLSPPPRRMPKSRAWQTYFMQEVAGDKYLEAQLLLMTIVTGALDVMTYMTYRVFASKQTGNTMFLALYAMELPVFEPGVEKNVGVSMGVFIGGAVFFGHIGHISRQRRRIWLLISNFFQAALFLAAAAMRYWASRDGTGPGAMGILAVLSFAQSGQIANALNVGMPELNTTMITGALIQLCTDPEIFKLHNLKRNRRFAFFCSMLLGCFLGAGVLKASSPSALLVLVASMKGALVSTFLFNRGIVEKKTHLENGEKKIEGHATPVTRVLWGD
ncbi:hypothetical protein CBER1_09384 [Cercospora berteroae]|uniref:DUF1275 domain protein n=1 Tax=Cercospora berteroae TaxID=357750 RepID=A0A2S6C8Z7_9PEZI|nr:hypothetical protein CBER1_09384 [Cercospora berteroae]